MADSTLAASKETVTILTSPLDELWRGLSCGREEIHGIKIDVQGMELRVLAGMRDTLLRWSPKLIIEFHAGVERSEVLDLLAECGYSSQGRAIDPDSGPEELADDKSYSFVPLSTVCAS
jgi:hypothetical protein